MNKKLSAKWVRSLTERGSLSRYKGDELKLIGMPVGGICAGQLYLGGDGKLWLWDIFNQGLSTGDGNYAHPPAPHSPIEQGFAVRIGDNVHALDSTGFSDVAFRGQYPVATVDYTDPAAPVSVSLTAYSPFIPLNTDDSSLPATVMSFAVKNTSAASVTCDVVGWLQNAALKFTGSPSDGDLVNRVLTNGGANILSCGWTVKPQPAAAAPRPDILIDDFSGDTYNGWTTSGSAFGNAPARGAGAGQTLSGSPFGKGLANSYNGTDSATGTLTSPEFLIERNFVSFLIGGGNHPGQTCVNLLVGDKVVRTTTGKDSDKLEVASWRVADLVGQKARIQVVDTATGGWGHIEVAQIVQTDVGAAFVPVDRRHDAGTMTLALLDPNASDKLDPAIDTLQPPSTAPAIGRSTAPMGENLIGRLRRTLKLAPGESKNVTFVVAWHFPNDEIVGGIQTTGRYYATRYADSHAVAEYVATNYARLSHETLLWRDTWYDSTLPYWFLDRTMANTSTLATSTSHRFGSGRFWGWEGVGCCHGTCTHVWHYAQAIGRLFPDIERNLRQAVDLGLAFEPATGIIGYRGEFGRSFAVDGQAGTILRIYREHQMSADASFLRHNWDRIKKSFDPMFALDPSSSGVMDGGQANTLDAVWYGKIAWTSSLYLAAVSAGAAMASEMGDDLFAAKCKAVLASGPRNFDKQLFNGEYYIQVADPAHTKVIGSYEGCEIDQVFGESWARQVGLPRFLPHDHVKSALQALYKYNFTPDVGAFRAAHKSGRWYAMAGEGGLIMCTFPAGEESRKERNNWSDMYFNECMTGFEHQVAGHMIWEDMVTEGLSIEKAIHDRYHPSRRNSYNEVECGDHYARAMASYGVYLAACGYEYHGPIGYIAFDPKIAPDNFKAAFTSADGWGSFTQKTATGKFSAAVDVMYGTLRLSNLVLAPPSVTPKARYVVALGGKPVKGAATVIKDGKLSVMLPEGTILRPGSPLTITTA